MTRYFEYGTDAVDCLKAKDKKLGAAIDAVGVVRREMDEDDLFSAIVHQIIGQQISTAAQATIWNRMRERLGEVTPSAVCAATEEGLQSCGITFTKARYIKSCAEKVASGQFDLDAVREMDDAEAIAALSSLEGVGVWTAEMLLLFCLGRPDILSYGDLAIHRGMRMVYHVYGQNVAWRMPRLLRRYGECPCPPRRPGPLRAGQYGVENASRSPMWRGECSALVLGSAREVEPRMGYHTGYENDVEHSGRARNGYGLWR